MKGFVPTPDAAVDRMVEKLFQHRQPTPSDRVLDPGSGRGAFVDGIIRYCSRRRLPLPSIVAIESDPSHAAFLKNRFHGLPAVAVRQADFLTAPLDEFDFIVGNPPYVSISGLDEAEKAVYRSRFATAVGRFDLYILFFEKAINALRRGGRIVFITPEKYLYVNTAKPLRQLLASRQVSELHYFPEDTFDNLVTYPLVTVVDAEEPRAQVRVTDRDGVVRSISGDLPASSWLPLVRSAPSASTAPKLQDITVRISCGVATGADSIFVRDNQSLPPDLSPFAYPTLAGREISSTQMPDVKQSMLVPYRSDGSLMAESELRSFGEYLRNPERRARLLRRTCVRSKPWYAFHENPPLADVLRPKLLCKDIGSHPIFVVDREGLILPRHSLYYIVPRDPSLLDELAEFLNSDHVARWLRDHCQRAANGFLRIQSHVLKQLPLTPELDPETVQINLLLGHGNGRRTA